MVGFFAVGLLFCQPSAFAQPKAATPAPLELPPPAPPTHIEAPSRPVMSQVEALEYDSVPLLSDAPPGSPLERTFRIAYAPQDLSVLHGPPPWYVQFPTHDAVVRVGGHILPWDVTWGGSGPPAGHAEWYVVDRARTTPLSLPLRRYEGEFDGRGTVATSATATRAIAVVPGVVYMFRRCVADCGNPAARQEMVSLVAPPAVWAESSDELVRSNGDEKPAFTVVSAVVHPGSSATLGVIVARDPRHTLVPGVTLPGKGALALEVDVVWEAGEDPELTVAQGSVEDDLDLVAYQGYRPRKPLRSK
jgi:hypothetical protein